MKIALAFAALLSLSAPVAVQAADVATPALLAAASPVEKFSVGPMLVERHGTRGRPIILIPGLSSGPYVWADTVRQFSKDHVMYVVTLPGFNGNPAAKGDLVAGADAWIGELIASRKLVKPVLIGHSMGAALSIAYAGKHPEQIGGVVMIDGLPVFESETRFLIDREGRIWRVLGNLVPSDSLRSAKRQAIGFMPPAQALAQLFGWSGHALDAKSVTAQRELDGGYIELDGPPPLAGPARARRVWFALAPGVLIPAWSLTAFTETTEDWYALVDATSGALLWRKNMRDYASTHPARFSVYVQADGKTPADSPAPVSPSDAVPGSGTQYLPIDRTVVHMLDVQNVAMSPNGWIDDCNGSENGCGITRGNNVDACLDAAAPANVCDAGTLDASGTPLGNPDTAGRLRDFLGTVPRDFEYTPAPLAGNPDAGDSPANTDARRGAIVQAFYTVNWFHDRMAALGFDEASGNFQYHNLLGQGGLDHDRISANVQSVGANTATSF